MAKVKLMELRTAPEWVDSELKNWSRWCWLGAWPHPLPPKQCASLEGNYSRFGEDAESYDFSPIPVCIEKAKAIQSVYDQMAPIHQHVLRAEYPQRWEWWHGGDCRKAAARFCGLAMEDDYLSILSSAIYRVIIVLEGSR